MDSTTVDGRVEVRAGMIGPVIPGLWADEFGVRWLVEIVDGETDFSVVAFPDSTDFQPVARRLHDLCSSVEPLRPGQRRPTGARRRQPRPPGHDCRGGFCRYYSA